jgi:hypothetical protein
VTGVKARETDGVMGSKAASWKQSEAVGQVIKHDFSRNNVYKNANGATVSQSDVSELNRRKKIWGDKHRIFLAMTVLGLPFVIQGSRSRFGCQGKTYY